MGYAECRFFVINPALCFWASSVCGLVAVINSRKFLAIISNIYSTSFLWILFLVFHYARVIAYKIVPKFLDILLVFCSTFFPSYFNLGRFLLSVFKLMDFSCGMVQPTYEPMKGSLHFCCSTCLFLAFSFNDFLEFWSDLHYLFLHIVYFFH